MIEPEPTSTQACPCGIQDGAEHGCTWATMRGAALLVGRSFQTIHTWQKRGLIGSTRGPDGRIWVCYCEVMTRSEKARRHADSGYVALLS